MFSFYCYWSFSSLWNLPPFLQIQIQTQMMMMMMLLHQNRPFLFLFLPLSFFFSLFLFFLGDTAILSSSSLSDPLAEGERVLFFFFVW